MSEPVSLFARTRKSLASFGPMPWVYLVITCALSFRYWWFMDDAYVYLRYADNAVFLDSGLVYNRGESVEGYSSPLWMLLWLVARWVGLQPVVVVDVACVLCVSGTIALLARANRSLSGAGPSSHLPLAYLATNYGVLTYFTSGMENPLVQLVAAAYVLYVLEPRSRLAEALVAISPLVRQELVVPLAVVLGFAFLSKRRWLRLALLAGVPLAAWVLFRVGYYALLVPNTYFLKDSVDLERGLIYLHNTFGTYLFAPLAAVAIVSVVVASRRKIEVHVRERVVLVLVASTSIAYVVKVGGDFFHFRYLCFPFVVLSGALGGLVERALPSLRTGRRASILWPAAGLLVSALIFLRYPPQLDHHPFFPSTTPGAVLKDGLYDAEDHRKRHDLFPGELARRVDADKQRAYARAGRAIHEDKIAYGGWCAENYADYDTYIVHALGLTEPTLARTASPSSIAGHKWGLVALARDLTALHTGEAVPNEYEVVPVVHPVGPGSVRRAVEENRAAPWIRDNLECIERIERRTYNRHAFFENLQLALERSCVVIVPAH